MTRRWEKPKKTPQLGLGLEKRGRFTPAARSTTDTSAAAGASVGVMRGGDAPMHSAGELAQAMTGVLERHTRKQRLAGVMLALTIRKEVFEYLGEHPEGATADEIAAAIHRTPFATRPRVSELRKNKLIIDSGIRRANASSHRNAIVWKLAPEEKQ